MVSEENIVFLMKIYFSAACLNFSMILHKTGFHGKKSTLKLSFLVIVHSFKY